MTNNDGGHLGRWIADQLEDVTLQKVTEVGFANAQANAGYIANGKSIAALMDTPLMHGHDALVIAAGPSMHRYDTAEIIKRSGFKGTIVAAESALSWCFRHEIIPDLVVTLDPDPNRIVRFFGDPSLNQEKIAQILTPRMGVHWFVNSVFIWA